MPEYIKPLISKENAKIVLSKPPGVFKKKRRIEKIELFHLPSYTIDVKVLTQNEHKTQSLCVDAVQGGFAFLQALETTKTSPKNIRTCPFFLSVKEVRERALGEYRLHLLRHGLKMRFKFEIKEIASIRPVYYPFWIGYFQRKGKIDFEVIDAVGGEHQGAAMRPVFMKALLHEKK